MKDFKDCEAYERAIILSDLDGLKLQRVESLIKSGKTVSVKNMQLVMRRGDIEVFDKLLPAFKRDGIDRRFPSGETALHEAACRLNTYFLKELLAQGANPKLRCEDGWLAISNAIVWGGDESVELLVSVSGSLTDRRYNWSKGVATSVVEEAIDEGGAKLKILEDYISKNEAVRSLDAEEALESLFLR